MFCFPQLVCIWQRSRTGLANICTNFMLIKIRLLKQAWLLSHSYYYCLDLWCYRGRGEARSRRGMAVHFSCEGCAAVAQRCVRGLRAPRTAEVLLVTRVATRLLVVLLPVQTAEKAARYFGVVSLRAHQDGGELLGERSVMQTEGGGCECLPRGAPRPAGAGPASPSS